MNKPELSVIIPAYNGASYIEAAIRSVCEGHGRTLEICVVDDGSHDETPSLVEAMASTDNRIRLVLHEHGGVAAARNRGLQETVAPFILFLDQDDLKPPGSIETQMSDLEEDPAAQVSIGETLMVSQLDQNNRPVAGSRSQQVLIPLLGAGLFRRSAFEGYGLFDNTFEMGSDFDFYVRLIEAGQKTSILHAVTLLHRRHVGNASGDFARTKLELLKVMQKSLQRRREAGMASPIQHPLLTAMRQQWKSDRKT